MQLYLLALSFLTCLPIKLKDQVSEERMAGSLAYYPLVGLTLGAVLVGVAWVGEYLYLGLAGDAMTIIALVVLTGGLHLDGLMDTADGLLSGCSRERKLEIMKDSNIGAMGAIVLVSYLILKITLLAALFLPGKYWTLLLMPAIGRWAMIYAIANHPYARVKPGLGSIFDSQRGKKSIRRILWGTMGLFVLMILLTDFMNLFALGCTVVFVHLFANTIAKSIGGHTGDTYGATGEMAELAYLLIAVLISSAGVNY